MAILANGCDVEAEDAFPEEWVGVFRRNEGGIDAVKRPGGMALPECQGLAARTQTCGAELAALEQFLHNDDRLMM